MKDAQVSVRRSEGTDEDEAAGIKLLRDLGSILPSLQRQMEGNWVMQSSLFSWSVHWIWFANQSSATTFGLVPCWEKLVQKRRRVIRITFAIVAIHLPWQGCVLGTHLFVVSIALWFWQCCHVCFQGKIEITRKARRREEFFEGLSCEARCSRGKGIVSSVLNQQSSGVCA